MRNSVRQGVAHYARGVWMTATEPHKPFGFKLLDWSIEVHPELIVGNVPTVKLRCYRVQPDGTLENIVEVRI